VAKVAVCSHINTKYTHWVSRRLYGTKYTHSLPQHRKSYNDVFYWSIPQKKKKILALTSLSISSLRMVQVDRNV